MNSHEEWLTRNIPVSEPLTRALQTSVGGIEQRIIVLEALGEALELPVHRFGPGAYSVLDALLEPLQDAMEVGPGSWTGDVESGRHKAIASAVVVDLTVDDLLNAFHQFGWQRQHLTVRDPEVGEIQKAIRDLFCLRLGQRVYNALEKWRKANVWPGAASGSRRPRPSA